MKLTLLALILMVVANSQNQGSAVSLQALYFPQPAIPFINNPQITQNPTTQNSNTSSIATSVTSRNQGSLINSTAASSAVASSSRPSTNNQGTAQTGVSAVQIQTQNSSNLRSEKITEKEGVLSYSNISLTNATLTNSSATLFDKNINDYFAQLPSFDTVKRLIQKADQVAMVKLIQQVVSDSSLNCDKKISYLLEVVGMVRSIIQDKYKQATQIQIIIDTANQEIARLNKQIERVQIQMGQIQLDQYNKVIKSDLALLTQYYNIFNTEREKLQVLIPQISQQKQEIAALKTAIEKDKENILIKQQTISQLDIKISLISQELVEAQRKRDQQSLSLLKSSRSIQINYAIISRTQKSIVILQNKGAEIQNKIDIFSQKISDLEVEVDRKRSDTTVATIKYLNLVHEVDDLKDKIAQESKNLRSDKLKILVDMIQILKEQEIGFQTEIDQYYYKCYANSEIKAQKNTSNVNNLVFVGNNVAVQNYIKKSYQTPVVMEPKSPVKLYRIDIFGTAWKTRYALPFPYYDNGPFVKQFSCMEGASSAEKGKGLIRAIYSDYIQIVNQDNRSLRFKLGSCTRLESTNEMPRAAQTLFWSGKPGRSYDEYHLFFGTVM